MVLANLRQHASKTHLDVVSLFVLSGHQMSHLIGLPGKVVPHYVEFLRCPTEPRAKLPILPLMSCQHIMGTGTYVIQDGILLRHRFILRQQLAFLSGQLMVYPFHLARKKARG